MHPHPWPAWIMQPATAFIATSSGDASSRTNSGDLPPSSSWTFLMVCAASAPTIRRPKRTLPVNETMSTIGFETSSSADVDAAAADHVDHAGREVGLLDGAGDLERVERGPRAPASAPRCCPSPSTPGPPSSSCRKSGKLNGVIADDDPDRLVYQQRPNRERLGGRAPPLVPTRTPRPSRRPSTNASIGHRPWNVFGQDYRGADLVDDQVGQLAPALVQDLAARVAARRRARPAASAATGPRRRPRRAASMARTASAGVGIAAWAMTSSVAGFWIAATSSLCGSTHSPPI